MVGEFHRDFWWYSLLPGMHRSDGLEQFAVYLPLQDVPSCASLERSQHLHIAGVCRQDDDPGISEFALNSLDGFDAVEVRHLQIHEGDVRAVRSKLFDRLAPIRRLGHELHVRLGVDERRDSLTEER